MHVEIEHLEKPGFLYVRSNWVKVIVQLTDAESTIVTRHKLWDYTVVKTERYDEVLKERIDKKYTVQDFCSPKGVLRNFETLGEAKQWAYELREHIKRLKDSIEANTSLTSKKETFDL